MSLLGRLEDLSLPDIIQIVFLSRRTGVLEIVDGKGRSTIMFHHGLVVDASSPDDPDLAGHLRDEGIIDSSNEAELDRMMEEGGLLGTALLELGAIGFESFSELVRERILGLVSPLLRSRDGEFNFILSDSASQFELPYDSAAVFRDGGISPQQLLGGTAGDKLKPLQGLEESMKAGKALLTGARSKREKSPPPAERKAPFPPPETGRSATEALDRLLPPTPPKDRPAAREKEPFEATAPAELEESPFSFTPLEEEEVTPAGTDEIPLLGMEEDEVEDASGLAPVLEPDEGSPPEEPPKFEPSSAAELPGVSDLDLFPLQEELSPSDALPKTPEARRPAAKAEPNVSDEIPTDAFVPAPSATPTLDLQRVGETIVLYQPDPMLRVAARRAFTKRGFDFLQFGNLVDAREAVTDLLKRNQFFVAFLDLAGTAAGSDSPELLLESIKKKDRHVPVLVLDKEADLRRRHDLLGLGADFYLTKPSPAHLQPGLAEETLALFADELMMFAERAFEARREQIGPAEPRLGGELEGLVGAERADRSFALLKRLISELTNPDDLEQVAQIILRMAEESMERGALFAIREEKIEGVGGFGVTGGGEDMGRRARRITIDRAEKSVLGDVARNGVLHRGKLRKSSANERLIASFGNLVPTEVIVLPIVNHDRVVGLVYGDNAETRGTIEDVAGLEIFLSQAGLAFENALVATSRKGAHG